MTMTATVAERCKCGYLISWHLNNTCTVRGCSCIGGKMDAKLDLNAIQFADIERAKRWHPEGIESWSALEWAGAMCGEAGEAANAAKKLKRVEQYIANINEVGRSLTTAEIAQKAVCKEVADTILYGLLLMARCGCTDPEAIIREVFNKKSEEYGFPERL